MMKYAVFGQKKITSEQEEWAANTTLKILEGKLLVKFPVTQNKRTNISLNASLANSIDYEPGAEFRSKCIISK